MTDERALRDALQLGLEAAEEVLNETIQRYTRPDGTRQDFRGRITSAQQSFDKIAAALSSIQPASQAAAALPERREEPVASITESDTSYARREGRAEGWNECLDALAAQAPTAGEPPKLPPQRPESWDDLPPVSPNWTPRAFGQRSPSEPTPPVGVRPSATYRQIGEELDRLSGHQTERSGESPEAADDDLWRVLLGVADERFCREPDWSDFDFLSRSLSGLATRKVKP